MQSGIGVKGFSVRQYHWELILYVLGEIIILGEWVNKRVGCKILRTLLSILVILSLCVSCQTATDKPIPSDDRFEKLPLPADSTAFYFKTKANWQDNPHDSLDTFVNQWYSKMLFSLKEPVLSNYQGQKEIYRFTWLRTFHHPISVKL